MGSEWRMPTSAETLELVENTDHYYIDLDGNILDKINYSKLRSICFVKQGETFDYNNRSNFIEFPFAGQCYNITLSSKGYHSNVWSSSDYVAVVECAHQLFCSNNGNIWGGDNGYSPRVGGAPIRGVHA